MSKVLVIASNFGMWAEELQAPWDALKAAGHDLTLATFLGKTPLPFKLSMDPDFIDPMLKIPMNPAPLIKRVNEILDTGEWDNPIKTSDAKMENYDHLVIVGGPGAAVDIAGNPFVHKLVVDGAHQPMNVMPSGLALDRELERQRLARARDRDDLRPVGKGYRKHGKR